MLQPKDTDRLNAYKNKTCIYDVYKRPIQTSGHIQTESDGMEKDISCKWKSKESWSSSSHIRQNRLVHPQDKLQPVRNRRLKVLILQGGRRLEKGLQWPTRAQGDEK